ncbi:2-acylglycerol O-acyltransferase 2-A [Leucoraja erinacea]|uniref:2-acylglycerol O-acyltransferase 2-A n=1 Tax=Leucoraja erinaceus TaxID=7782 RepID=UPI002454E028|nr:2-acylglycerol O-acyltransferase 2-A [Leucoraja erinacea]
MGIKFAPLRIPLERRLQTLGVLQWVFSFLALSQCCLLVFVFLLFTKYWCVSVLYTVWMYVDRETPSSGGRRSTWVRNWAIWRYFRDYFPITLVKTADLDPSHNYLFGFHPHGVLVAGAFGNFCTEATGFSHMYPGLTPHLLMLPFWFNLPFFREYIIPSGLVPSCRLSAARVLGRVGGGQVAVVAVGGPPEALDARPGALTLRVRARTGFIRLALTTGAQLVPVFSFGENELFDQVENPPGSALRYAQDKLQKVMGLSFPLFHARGVFQYSFGLLPYRKPIYTVVGKPIPVERNASPTDQDIESLHKAYLDQLTCLFEENKIKFGLAENSHLELI